MLIISRTPVRISLFYDNKHNSWYVMGAYTFESSSPYRVTAISHYPILFKGALLKSLKQI